MNIPTLAPFARAYIMAALWTFDDDAPSGDYETSGRFEELLPLMDADSLTRLQMDADAFQSTWGFLWRESGLFAAEPHEQLLTDEQAGHDFWLTRNGHGSGFWDRDIGAAGEQLTQAAHKCGECNLYRGDDGRIYAS